MTRPAPHPDDPRHLVYEAFRIEGIGEAECRAIFFDWALGLPAEADPAAAARALIRHHAGAPEDHPMRRLLEEAALGQPPGRRRRGRRGRGDG